MTAADDGITMHPMSTAKQSTEVPMWVVKARGFQSRAEHDAAQARAAKFIREFKGGRS